MPDRGEYYFLPVNSSFYNNRTKGLYTMEDEVLRIEVKLIKSFYDITYKDIAEVIGIKQRSLYNWLAG